MGGKFTLSALYRVKSTELKHEAGVMGYQNLSWDICDLTKKVFRSKKFLELGQGARKVGPQENLSILKFWISRFIQNGVKVSS